MSCLSECVISELQRYLMPAIMSSSCSFHTPEKAENTSINTPPNLHLWKVNRFSDTCACMTSIRSARWLRGETFVIYLFILIYFGTLKREKKNPSSKMLFKKDFAKDAGALKSDSSVLCSMESGDIIHPQATYSAAVLVLISCLCHIYACYRAE